MIQLKKPAEAEEIEKKIELHETLNKIFSQTAPENISKLNGRRRDLEIEMTNYHYEMAQNGSLNHNKRKNLSQFKDIFEWLYDNPSKLRGTDFIDKIRDAYVSNGIICPYCGISPCRTLDHYYNKALLPQFSFLPENLIPCCGDCNKDKGSKTQFSRYKRTVNPFYDDYPNLITGEPSLYIAFIESPLPNVDFNYFITPNRKLEHYTKKHIHYHLISFKIKKIHQEAIRNSFWRNARTLREYCDMLSNNIIDDNVHRTLIDNFSKKILI
ncbi:hypothetical protein [Rheinheimera mangrovi]|uniref:hypothetical protein n=1 Tax=Rheinheimera mangrovi TaxID=2498451 RepID=UPI000F8EA591|nr:hypothetical protein [Rheinheimera mangrovi]